MEPANKKVRLITDHFRVALKPRDLNVALKRKAIPIVTISDDENDDNDNNLTQPSKLKQATTKTTTTTTTSTTAHATSTSTTTTNNAATNTSHLKRTLTHLQNQNHNKNALTTLTLNTDTSYNTKTITNNKNNSNSNLKLNNKSLIRISSPHNKYSEPTGKHHSVEDYDKSLLGNVLWEPHYARDSFDYDRQLEVRFRTNRYLQGDTTNCELKHELTPERRAEFVDWLVELQMRFSIDHEPLYMAVKMADQYLMNKSLANEHYLLLFITSILIAAKFDERIPPLSVSNLIRLSRARFGIKYTRKQMISFEVDLLTTLDFNIRYPLSYGFLRRFARCTRSDMKTLNLARYILESSLLDYEMIEELESKIAAGSLLLAFKMLQLNGAWDETAKFYTGYNEKELHPILVNLRALILRLSKEKTAIRRKYNTESFMEVARIPLPPVLVTPSK